MQFLFLFIFIRAAAIFIITTDGGVQNFLSLCFCLYKYLIHFYVRMHDIHFVISLDATPRRLHKFMV